MADTPTTPVAPAPPVPSPRQTFSYLRRLFEAHRLEAKSKLGQCYLIDLNLIDVIIREAELDSRDAVLEVGTGTGSLTARIAALAGSVCSIEIDHTFLPLAREIVGDRSNVMFMLGDCLAKKSLLNPDMLAALEAVGAKTGCTRRKLVANLPYAIATPLISNLLVDGPPLDRMVFMVQWEIAERLKAPAGTKDYNALSVLVQSIADVETVRKVGPTNFWPAPKVDSAIVKIVPNAAKRALVGDVRKFRAFLRDLYVHRRKNLRQSLSGSPRGHRDKKDVDATLLELGIDGSLRAEALDIAQHLRLNEKFG